MDWKRTFVRAAGVGAGVAITLAIIVGAGVWYDFRPKPPRPWDSKTIQAEYDGTTGEHTSDKIGFRYVLKNNGADDCRIDDADALQLSIRVGEDGELTPFNHVLSIDTPIFVPAGQKTMVFLCMKTGKSFPHLLPENATDEQEKQYDKDVLDYLDGSRIAGFSAFDEKHRIEIEFPTGWKKAQPKK